MTPCRAQLLWRDKPFRVNMQLVECIIYNVQNVKACVAAAHMNKGNRRRENKRIWCPWYQPWARCPTESRWLHIQGLEMRAPLQAERGPEMLGLRHLAPGASLEASVSHQQSKKEDYIVVAMRVRGLPRTRRIAPVRRPLQVEHIKVCPIETTAVSVRLNSIHTPSCSTRSAANR